MASKSLLLALAVAFAAIVGASAQSQRWKNYNWKQIYNAWPQNPSAAVTFAQQINCTGSYALCAYAECRIVTLGSKNSPAIAECGCFAYPNESGQAAWNFGSPAGILSKRGKEETSQYCGKGNKCANEQNTAPMCKLQNHKPKPQLYQNSFDIISTFNAQTWPAYQDPEQQYVCSAGQYTNCYSAACLNVKPWNYKSTGANSTCYCPVYNVQKGQGTFFNTNPDKNCYGTKGWTVGSVVYNGLGLTAKGR